MWHVARYVATCHMPPEFAQLANGICFPNHNFVYLFVLCSKEWSEAVHTAAGTLHDSLTEDNHLKPSNAKI